MQQLPSRFGPGKIDNVLREAVQACIDCANHERSVFSALKEGTGKVVATGICTSILQNCAGVLVDVCSCQSIGLHIRKFFHW